jgi:hypothetical protein
MAQRESTDLARCTCGRLVEGRPYEHPFWGITMRLHWSCHCGLVVTAYSAGEAEGEFRHERTIQDIKRTPGSRPGHR